MRAALWVPWLRWLGLAIDLLIAANPCIILASLSAFNFFDARLPNSRMYLLSLWPALSSTNIFIFIDAMSLLPSDFNNRQLKPSTRHHWAGQER